MKLDDQRFFLGEKVVFEYSGDYHIVTYAYVSTHTNTWVYELDERFIVAEDEIIETMISL